MTPEKREELTNQLADQGLSVLLTHDFDSILIELARLAQFERLMMTALENDPLELLDVVMAEVRAQQEEPPHVMLNPADLRPMETIDIPWILMEVNRPLQAMLNKQTSIDIKRVHAAVAAFVGILRTEER